MSYVVVTKEDMEKKLQAAKGWKETFSGNEFVYDFHLSRPIVVKVASSIRRDTDKGRNKGTDAIRIFAVEKDTPNKDDYKVIRGLVKAKRFGDPLPTSLIVFLVALSRTLLKIAAGFADGELSK